MEPKASPVRSYLTRFASQFPEVGFFVTSGGRGADRALAQMEQLCGKMPLGRLALCQRALCARWSVYLAEFLEGVLLSWELQARQAAQ